jgi:cell division protein ZapA
MKQLEVQILGQSYLLGCPEGGEARLLEAVERVDTAMCKIRDAGKVRARDRIAVLAALNLAFDLSAHNEAAAQAPTTISSGMAPLGDAFPSSQVATGTAGGDSDVLLLSLLERLDAALGDDGRLL